MKSVSPIDVLGFDDSRAYVVACAGSPSLGLRGLSRRAGFRSPSTLSMICRGQRRLTYSGAEKLARGLALSGRRKSYLLALVSYEHASTAEEKIEARERLLKLKSQSDETQLNLRQYRCLAVWYYPAIYEMVALVDFRPDAEWIAKKLGGQVSEAEVRRAVGDLINLGLLVQKENKLVQTETAVSTAEDVKDIAVHRYHQAMLERAQAALAIPLDEREMNGLTVRLSSKQMPLVKEKIRKFRKELNELLSSQTDADQVYQLNVQLFPLTVKDTNRGDKR